MRNRDVSGAFILVLQQVLAMCHGVDGLVRAKPDDETA
jgi:hypothetical protein